ncbi:MAG: alpha-L-fucosidase [Clostridiales bacterium]|nr:alpha-L-fucosidase [Clostridiales bacterium]
MDYVERFEKLGFGMFVHFGLYSIIGKGEWAQHILNIPKEKYCPLINKFKVKKTWAKNLVKTAKDAGCKYITITTRHHDGFSLYDTKGLNDYDAPHSPCGRDLIKEFVDECNKAGIVPFFYHTLLDWHHESYDTDFPKYIDYLIKSVELLCTNYGKIGGIWFDGMWNKPNEDWQEDRLYSTIRKHQPEAMIINNTGLDELGKVGHPELDSVTFERGKPAFVDNSDRHRAGEMCQVVNDHWGYAKLDINYKSVGSLIMDLINCRKYNCNFLLNVGPMPNGDLRTIDRGTLTEIGKWIKFNKNFIYDVKSSDIDGENTIMLKGKDCYYAIAKAPMVGDVNVAIGGKISSVKINAKIKSATWLDDGRKINVKNGCEFDFAPFGYGISMSYRVAKLKLEK